MGLTAEPSRTAIIAAVARGVHRLEHAPPWVVDDPFALILVGPGWREILATRRGQLSELELAQGTAGMAVRARFVEDRLVEGAFAQYVILGAGLDSFAWRRPDLLGSVRVFEVDHPSTQGWKQGRATTLGLPDSDHHVLVPVDFERDTLTDRLTDAGLDWSRPALFSWLGVTMYLTADAITATLRQFAAGAAGSEIAVSYVVTDDFLDGTGRSWLAKTAPVVAGLGEPFRTRLSPSEAETLIESCGLRVGQHPTRDELRDRYFTGRVDGLMSWTVERLITAIVPA